jgi:hypothetical protein
MSYWLLIRQSAAFAMNSLATPIAPALLRRRSRGASILLVTASCVVGAAALATVAYLLWPTWRAAVPDDPSRLPITVGSALFNVPAKAIRMRMQRRAGPQERIDLAFEYPSLLPPEPQAHVTADSVEGKPVAANRMFLSIAADGGVVTPIERVRTIYPRYVEAQADVQDGLTGRAFRENSPYRGEDLFMADRPAFVVRCTREGMTPGICLSERRVDGAHLTFRFPRSWLSDWRNVAASMDKLVERMQGKTS